jgi:hypothetical protein
MVSCSCFVPPGLLGENAIWRVTGLRAAGRTLVNALASPDPNVRTIAGILLVRAGQKAEPYIEEAIHRQLNLPQVLVMAGDIGAKKTGTGAEEIRIRSGWPENTSCPKIVG